MDIVQRIYEIVATFPTMEKYGLSSQITKSAVSIPSNIAEGAGRKTDKDFMHFLSIATGSMFELETQILIAERIGYITQEQSLSLSEIYPRFAANEYRLRQELGAKIQQCAARSNNIVV